MGKPNRIFRTALSASLATGLASTALAESESEPLLEEIVVSAQKREQSIDDVAMSLSVMTGDKIVDQGFNDLQDVSSFTPGLLVEQGDVTGTTLSIRGVNNGGPNVAFEQAVAVFNDGVYSGRSLQSVAGIYDIAQVEVLFGPQPVYFGQSAIAGLVSYTSKRPGEELDGYVVAEAGSFDSRKFEGAVGVPISENWGVRVAGKYTESDGWTDVFFTGEDGNSSEDTAFRFSIAGDITDGLSLYAKTEYFEQETSGAPFPTVSCNPALGVQTPGGPLAICQRLPAEFVNYGYNDSINKGGSIPATEIPSPMAPTFLDLTGLDIASNDALGLDVDGTNTTLQFTWDVSDTITVSSITGVSEYESAAIEDFDSSPYAAVMIANEEEFEMVSQELRVQSNNDGAMNWMAGVYYQDQELDYLNRTTAGIRTQFGPPGSYSSGDYNEEATYLGAFATVTYDVTDALTIDAGVRWSDVEKSAYLLESGGGLAVDDNGDFFLEPIDDTVLRPGGRCLGDTPGNSDCAASIVARHGQATLDAMGGNTDLELDDSEVNYQLAATYAISEEVTGFARYVTGFKAGGFSRGGSSFSVSTKGAYDAENAESLEGGFRLDLGNVRANLTLFYTEYEDRQVEAGFIDPATNARSLVFINAAEATIQGFEADVLYVAEFGTRFNAAFSYTDSEFDEYTNAGCLNIERASPLCVNSNIDLSGTEFDGQPDWNLTLGVSQEFELSDSLLLTLGIDASIFDDFDDTRGLPEEFSLDYRDQDGFTLLNARAAIGNKEGDWEVALYGRNLTDEEYWLTQPSGENPFGTATAAYSRPVSYGVQLRYNF